MEFRSYILLSYLCQRFQYIQTKNLIEEVNIYMNGMDHSRKMAYGSILLKNGSDWHRLIWYGMWNGSERFYSIWGGDRWQTSPLAAQDPASISLSVYISSSTHHAAAQSNHYKFMEMPVDSSKSFIFLASCWWYFYSFSLLSAHPLGYLKDPAPTDGLLLDYLCIPLQYWVTRASLPIYISICGVN